MKYLLDTHLLLWLGNSPGRLPRAVCHVLEDMTNEIYFSVLSLWEIAIKKGLGRADFQVDARVLRRELLRDNYKELTINSEHVISVDALPLLHKDPFDRLLIAQATAEGITLLTEDKIVATYPGPIQKV